MDIKLKRDWFYPADAGPPNDKRAISGGRMRKGIHRDVDPTLRDYLPKDVVILTDASVVEEDEVVEQPSLEDMDVERATSDVERAIEDDAEAARKAAIQAKRVAALAKARQAKKDKKEAK